jgi:hypothetical protein
MEIYSSSWYFLYKSKKYALKVYWKYHEPPDKFLEYIHYIQAKLFYVAYIYAIDLWVWLTLIVKIEAA